MSFFDEDDEPRQTTRPPRPRRASTAGGTAADSRTLLVRRLVALGLGALVLVLLAVAINSCRESQNRNSLKDYNRKVAAIGTESQQTGGEFFKLFNQTGGQSPQDLQTAVSGYRVQAEQQLKQAQGLDVPGAMNGAQQSLLISLQLRHDGLDYIAQRIRTALGDSGPAVDTAINQIAGQMQAFDASDVLYSARVVPLIRRALDDNEVGGQSTPRSRFLPDVAWMSPQFVAQKLDQQLTSGGGRRPGQPTGPGLHGTALQSTAYGSVTLSTTTSNRLTYQPSQPFVVTFVNGGQNDEFDVKVTLRISAGSARPITLTRTVPAIKQGATATANLALDRTPPIGAAATIQVEIAPVPGEKRTDNNKATYEALFQRG